MASYITFKPGKEIEWIELNLLLFGRKLSKSKLESLSGEDESSVDGWLTELNSRQTKFKNPYYTIASNIVAPNCTWKDVPEYFLCLYYAFNGANDLSGGTALFERISAEALKHFLGGSTITTGFPSSLPFNDSLDLIALTCHEQRGRRALTTYKDDGVDVVGYKLFDDQRSSNLYVLLQCAAGKHWSQKKPINLNRWLQYIYWYSDNLIQSISTVEYVEQRKWHARTSTYGMLLDRLRIYNFLYGHTIDTTLRNDVTTWCQTKIAAGI